jgi:hypothetical protein
MNWIKRGLVLLIGYGLIFGLLGFVLVLFVAPVSVYLNHNGVYTDSGVLSRVQRLTYPYVRNFWNAQRECVALDPVLVYKPAVGTCNFQNIEFDTVLTFSDTGRVHPGLDGTGAPIAVIGDSHAMGWGVGDTETFSYLLQEHTGQPVLNLGVGSYATERSLRRMLQLPQYQEVETIILQYGDNDLAENQNFPIDPAHWVAVFEDKFEEGDLRERTYFQKLAFAYPVVTTELLQRLVEIPAAILGLDGPPEDAPSVDHSGPLQTVLEAFADDLAGRRIILFYVNGYGVRIADLEVSLDAQGVPVEYIDLGLDPEQHFFFLDDHLNAAGHKQIADTLIERFF